MRYILAIDQGTTSTRSIVFGPEAAPMATAQKEFRQIYPHPGWVEHDPNDIWDTTLSTMRTVLSQAGLTAADLVAIGITNQRETTLVWSRETGEAIGNAIVWQDRRTADFCAKLEAEGRGDIVSERTGLLLDSYFSATKIRWMLENIPGARARAERGELAFGTVDTYLLWRLTNGAVHATDATNASRTLLFNIRTGEWDEDLLRLFGVPASLLPEARDTAGELGVTAAEHLGRAIPILSVVGDQQSALVGQACLEPGMVKATYGTGGFVLLNTGASLVRSQHRLVTTIAYQWAGTRHYALEGSIFVVGAAVKWLRDALGIIASSAEAGELAAMADLEQPVYFVPAFAGLGAPYWNSNARGTVTGITLGTTRKELARAVLESVGYQTRDLLGAMYADAAGAGGKTAKHVIRVDGGLSASDWSMQFLADILGVQVDRPTVRETTALGAALLAGWQAGLYPGPEGFSRTWRLERSFKPGMPEAVREQHYRGWQDAVARALLAPAN